TRTGSYGSIRHASAGAARPAAFTSLRHPTSVAAPPPVMTRNPSRIVRAATRGDRYAIAAPCASASARSARINACASTIAVAGDGLGARDRESHHAGADDDGVDVSHAAPGSQVGLVVLLDHTVDRVRELVAAAELRRHHLPERDAEARRPRLGAPETRTLEGL